jgi:hypothetical protein
MVFSARSSLIVLAIVLAVSVPAVTATGTYSWWNWGGDWKKDSALASYKVSKDTEAYSYSTGTYSWWNWGGHWKNESADAYYKDSNYTESSSSDENKNTWAWGYWGSWDNNWGWKGTNKCGSYSWWWGGCSKVYEAHYASVAGKVQDEEGKPVKGAALKVNCYQKLWDPKKGLWSNDTLFHSYNCTTDAYGAYAYSKVPTKEFSHHNYGGKFSYCQVNVVSVPPSYTYVSSNRKDFKIGYWYINSKSSWNDAKTWKPRSWSYDLSENKKYTGPVYTLKKWSKKQ